MVDEMDAETMRLMLDQVLKENRQLKAEIADVRTSKKSMTKLLPDLDLTNALVVPPPSRGGPTFMPFLPEAGRLSLLRARLLRAQPARH